MPKSACNYSPTYSKCVRSNQKGICSDNCFFWHNIACCKVSLESYNRLSNCNEYWLCIPCLSKILPFITCNDDDFNTAVSLNDQPLIKVNCSARVKFLRSKLCNISKNAFDLMCSLYDKEESDKFLPYKNCNYQINEFSKECTNLECNSKLSCLFLNRCSIVKNYDDFSALVQMSTCKWDFIALAETWLQDSLAHMYNMPGYKLHTRQRQNGAGGGLCMYINEAYESNVILCAFKYDCFEHLEQMISSHNLPTKIKISNIYRPPHGFILKFLDEFSQYLD